MRTCNSAACAVAAGESRATVKTSPGVMTVSDSRSPEAQRGVVVRDVTPDLFDDLISVCSKTQLKDPVHAEGVQIKREWLTEVTRANGPIAKLAYLDGKPAAQLMFYPEDAGPQAPGRRDVLVLYCVFTGAPEDRRHGLASSLLRSFLEEVRAGKLKSVAGRRVRFIRAPVFETGEGLSMAELYGRYGFSRGPEGSFEMYREVQGTYEPPSSLKAGSTSPKAVPPTGDRRWRLLPVGRALVFYTPHCQWSYVFAERMAAVIREMSPKHEVLLVDAWRDPAAGDWPGAQAVVDGIPIYAHVAEGDGFQSEVAAVLKEGPR